MVFARHSFARKLNTSGWVRRLVSTLFVNETKRRSIIPLNLTTGVSTSYKPGESFPILRDTFELASCRDHVCDLLEKNTSIRNRRSFEVPWKYTAEANFLFELRRRTYDLRKFCKRDGKPKRFSLRSPRLYVPLERVPFQVRQVKALQKGGQDGNGVRDSVRGVFLPAARIHAVVLHSPHRAGRLQTLSGTTFGSSAFVWPLPTAASIPLHCTASVGRLGNISTGDVIETIQFHSIDTLQFCRFEMPFDYTRINIRI